MPDSINIIDRYAVPDLMGKNFFIPDYQRGYRWDKIQIFQLLSDINSFRKHGKGAFYCLQPVVVKQCGPEFIKSIKTTDGTSLHSELDHNIWYEVIDGQQRLTTIKLIITYNNLRNTLQTTSNCFKLYYQTRPLLGNLFDSLYFDTTDQQFKSSLQPGDLDIDSYHVLRGLNYINDWFTTKGAQFEERLTLNQLPDFMSTFLGEKVDLDDDDQEDNSERIYADKSVQVLWYELKDGTNPRNVFKRLNDNKIELTNSELIRALFLSESAEFKTDPVFKYKNSDEAKMFIREHRQAHIIEQWDVIEHQLRDDNFWAFVTNNGNNAYSCRIEYLFDLISQKHITPQEKPFGLNKKDERYTYLYFDRDLAKIKKEDSKKDYLWELWKKIETFYSTLVFWYEDRNLYHWIGYLIYVKGDEILPQLLKSASEIGRNAFKIKLIEMILGKEATEKEEAVAGTVNLAYDTLSYDNNREEIENILILYNTETYRLNPQLQFMPFKEFKDNDNSWTLEHIHAQNSEGLPKNDNLVLIKWLEENIDALQKNVLSYEKCSDPWTKANNLIADLEQSRIKGQKGISYEEIKIKFDAVLNFYNSFCRKPDQPIKVHQFSNMTLLSGAVNTAIGKSAFEIKRQKLVKMDAEGKFIPYCTKKVFFKYCNIKDMDFEVQQTACWDDFDKANYQKDVMNVIDNLSDTLQKLKDKERSNG